MRYAGVLQVAGGQAQIFVDFSERFTAEALTEAFEAAAAASIRGKGFLNWVKIRLERRQEEEAPLDEDWMANGDGPLSEAYRAMKAKENANGSGNALPDA